MITIQTTDAFGNPVTADYSPAHITVIGRIDSTIINPGTKVRDVKVYYVADPNDTIGAQLVGDCAVVNGVPVPIGNGFPCVSKRVAYPKNPKGGVDPALSLDFEIWMLNDRNGRFEFF